MAQVAAPARRAQGAVKSIDGYARVTSVTREDVTDNKLSRLTCDLEDVPGGGNDKAFANFIAKHIANNGVAGCPIYVHRDPDKNEIKVGGKKEVFQINAIYKLTLTLDPNVLIGKYIVTAAAKK